MRGKRIISLFLSIVVFASTVLGVSITSQASSIKPIAFGETVSGECGYGEYDGRSDFHEHDYFEFKVPVSGTVTFDVTGTTYRGTYAPKDDIEIHVYKSPYDMKDFNYDYEIHANYSDAFGYGITKKSINLQAGTYYIRTEPFCSGGNAFEYYDYSFVLTYKPNILKPSSFKVLSRNTKLLKLSWRKVPGANGYQLQRKSGDRWITVENTTATSCTVKNLKAGTAYDFRVRTYRIIDGKRYYSDWTTLKTPTEPSKPSITTPSTNGKHQVTAKWKKVSACSGYQVQYSTSSKFKSPTVKTVSGRSKTSCTTKLKKGKKYYIRVRSYKNFNGKKYYSAWSNAKSIKCK